MKPDLIEGDLLELKVEIIVNAWNRNIIPWWLLWPRGVSGAIKRRGGCAPFREVAQAGPIPLGGAVLTGAGTLPFKGIIHVAGINLLWQATEQSVRDSVRNAMRIVDENGFASVAFPLLGAGSLTLNAERSLAVMLAEFAVLESAAKAVIVRFKADS